MNSENFKTFMTSGDFYFTFHLLFQHLNDFEKIDLQNKELKKNLFFFIH